MDEQTKVRMETGRSPRRTSIKMVHAGRRSPAGSRCAPLFFRGKRGKKDGANEPAARLRDVEKGRKRRSDVRVPAEACVLCPSKAVGERFSPSPRPSRPATYCRFLAAQNAVLKPAARGAAFCGRTRRGALALFHGTRNCLQIQN